MWCRSDGLAATAPAGPLSTSLPGVGVDLSNISTDESLPTLFSVCFAYPSGDGGNLTTLNSASAAVTCEAVKATEPLFARFQRRGIGLVLPEVP